MPSSERDTRACSTRRPAEANRTDTIRDLNDSFRSSLTGGRVMITAGVEGLGLMRVTEVLQSVRSFSAFNEDNDPHGEHDFGALTCSGERLFWKIDYYDRELDGGSEDPADPGVTTRVLTIMLASEY